MDIAALYVVSLLVGVVVAGGFVWWLMRVQRQMRQPATRNRPLATGHPVPRQLSRRSHRISLARQRRRYQARIRQMERQQLALIYLLYLTQQRPARPVAQAQRAEVAHA